MSTLEQNMDFFKLVAELGFPIAGACAAGYFVFLTLKFILAGVTSSVKGMVNAPTDCPALKRSITRLPLVFPEGIRPVTLTE